MVRESQKEQKRPEGGGKKQAPKGEVGVPGYLSMKMPQVRDATKVCYGAWGSTQRHKVSQCQQGAPLAYITCRRCPHERGLIARRVLDHSGGLFLDSYGIFIICPNTRINPIDIVADKDLPKPRLMTTAFRRGQGKGRGAAYLNPIERIRAQFC